MRLFSLIPRIILKIQTNKDSHSEAQSTEARRECSIPLSETTVPAQSSCMWSLPVHYPPPPLGSSPLELLVPNPAVNLNKTTLLFPNKSIHIELGLGLVEYGFLIFSPKK